MKVSRVLPVLFCLLPVALPAGETDQLPDLAPLPVTITSFGATFHEGAIYVYGGRLGSAHTYNRELVNKPLYRLRFSGDAEWEELPSDEPALGPVLWSHESGVIRIGGMQPRNAEGEEQDLASVSFVRRFDLKTEKWRKGPSLPEGPMNGFGLAAMVDEDDGNLFITGFAGEIHVHDGKDGWSKVGAFDHGRMFARLVDPPNAPVVVMGGAGKEGRPTALEYAPGDSH